MFRRWSLLMVLATLLYMASPANAGWIMLEQNGDKTLISNGNLRGTSGGVSWIFNGPKKEMAFIDAGQKIYWRGTIDDYCSSSAKMIEQMMKSVPEDQRKMMEQMMAKEKQSPGHKVDVVKDGDGKKIAGFKTMKYRVLVNGELFEEVWLTTDASIMKEYKPLIPMIQKFNSCLGNMDMEFTPEKSAEYQKLWQTGFQLRSVKYEYGNPETETNVVKMEKKNIADKEFEVPAGYQQRSFAELMQSRME
jgi:hypothetical protein